MPRQARLNALSATKVAALKEPGRFHDGGGLYLQVQQSPDGTITKSWLFRYQRERENWQGLGPLADVSLAKARQAASECREHLRNGRDPIRERDLKVQIARLAATPGKTFAECASEYIEANASAWRNGKHRAQWEATLKTHANPVIGRIPVAAINTDLVLKVLRPIWFDKTETATRIRQRIETVLDYATTLQYRDGLNPARWRGNIENLLPKRAKVAKVEHYAALPFDRINAFVTDLRKQEGVGARALEFLILTAARTGEVVNARWEEVDLKATTWTIPGSRMKAGREHVVPLSARAVAILKLMREFDSEWIFPGHKAGTPLSNMAMLALLRRMERRDIVVHGFRSTFRDWCAESTNYPREVCEMALAHTIKSAAEAAYRRGDLLEKRRLLMSDWQRFIDKPAGKATVTRIRNRG